MPSRNKEAMTAKGNFCWGLLLMLVAGLMACSQKGQRRQQSQDKGQAEMQAILVAAAASDLPQIAAFLSRNPLLVNARNDLGETPLSKAVGALFPREELVKFLIEKGADVKAQNTMGSTALHIAASKGRKPLAVLLLASGANINARDNYNRTPLNNAVFFNRSEVAELLIAKGAEMSVFDSAALGKIRHLRQLLERNPGLVYARDQAGQTPLHWAAIRNQREAAKMLLKHGSNPSAADKTGATPGHVARELGHKELATLLGF